MKFLQNNFNNGDFAICFWNNLDAGVFKTVIKNLFYHWTQAESAHQSVLLIFLDHNQSKIPGKIFKRFFGAWRDNIEVLSYIFNP